MNFESLKSLLATPALGESAMFEFDQEIDDNMESNKVISKDFPFEERQYYYHADIPKAKYLNDHPYLPWRSKQEIPTL